jgi:hypothetical protein
MTLVLKRYPVTAIETMKFSTVLVDPTTYFLQPDTGEIALYVAFPRGYNTIEVVYTAGWTADTIPTQLKYAVYDLATKIDKA